MLKIRARLSEVTDAVNRLRDATLLRVLGRSLGVERIVVGKDSARLSFRAGFVPRMAVLEGPLRQRQTEVEIRRMEPLSVVFHQIGIDSILETLVVGLEALNSAHSAAA